MRPFVLDCSFAMCWAFRDQADADTDAVYAGISLSDTWACAPALFFVECLNVLLMAERRGRYAVADIAPFLANLRCLPIRIEPPPLDHDLRALGDLARQQQLTAYDALYLEMALRSGLPLATRDRQLAAAAARVGVSTDVASLLPEA